MTRKSLRSLLVRAARLIEDEAKLGRDSCAVGEKTWACADCKRHPCPAEKLHGRQLVAVKELRDAAAKGISA